MKKITNRKLRLGYQIKISDEKGQELPSINRRVKSRLLQELERVPAKNRHLNYYLRVTYLPDVYNHGDYNTKKDLIFALNQFTEKPLLDYLAETKSGHWKKT